MSLVKGYSKITKVESFKTGIQYHTKVFIPDTAGSTSVPVVGSLATWAPTTAYVTDIKRVPDSQHYNYEIVAQDVELVMEESSIKGTMFKKFQFLDKESIASLVPAVGSDVAWTRIDGYLLSYSFIACGTSHYFVELVAVEDGYRVM